MFRNTVHDLVRHGTGAVIHCGDDLALHLIGTITTTAAVEQKDGIYSRNTKRHIADFTSPDMGAGISGSRYGYGYIMLAHDVIGYGARVRVRAILVASLKSDAVGPMFTYHSGPHTTCVDYVLVNLSAAHISNFVKVLEDHPLNTSDHLPLTIELNCNPLLVQQFSTSQRIDWDKALLSGQLAEYSLSLIHI